MATWQLDLELVPRAKAEALPLREDGHIEADVLDSTDWWEGVTPPLGYEHRLESFLPWSAPWAAGWSVYGEEDGNRLDVIAENGRVAEIRARIDARSVTPEVLEQFIAIALYLDCLFITLEGRVIAPDVDTLWVEMELSPAVNFVRNPEVFLARRTKRRKHD